MKTRNTNRMRATFSRLKMNAFGIPNVVDWKTEIEVYQARVSPELWRATPMMKHGTHKWEGSSAAAVMQLVAGDFEAIVKPWTEWTDKNVCIGLASGGAADRGAQRTA